MKAIALLALVICLAFAKQAPQWPKQYYARGIFTIPYWNIVEPLEIYYDGVNNRELINYYNGMASFNWRFDTQTLYEVIPRIDQQTCFTTSGIGNGPLVTLLPDLSQWTYAGLKWKNGVSCDSWVQYVTNFNVTATYTMYVDARTSNPVELHLDGYDFVFGSHPDIYIMKFQEYQPVAINPSTFVPNALCNSSMVGGFTQAYRAKTRLGQLGVFNPPKIEHEFDLFAARYKKAYSSPKEYAQRRNIYLKNKEFIDMHNNDPSSTYKMAMNHLGDLTHEEVRALLMPRPKGVDRSKVNANADGYHTRSGAKLPDYVNWVEEGAVTFVKDQGVCGSCWTFGTTGAIEGAYFMKYGRLVSLSEQQIVDCAWGQWGSGNSGCDGGFAGPAFDWVKKNGGIALEETYRYLMIDHYCNAFDVSSGVQVTGYVNVTEGSEEDLMDAVATVGPVTIAIDAAHEHFEYYTSGVYYNPNCKNDVNSLDHQVLVVGYGTENGQDYWLVKNSWSTHWGDQGYVKMARNRGNNCGIATQATYAIVA